MIFPISKAKYKIIKCVYEHPNIKISQILKLNKISQKSGYIYISELLDANIISEKIDSPLRLLSPEFSDAGKFIFSLVEEEKKLNFLKKHKELKGILLQFEKQILSTAETALIFGSFAKNSEHKESDIDLLIIGIEKDQKKIEKIVENCFITVKRKVSIRFVTKEEFVDSLKKEDEFVKQILNDHIILFNSFNWINLRSKLK